MKVIRFFIAIIAIGNLFTLSNCGDSKPAAEPILDKQLRLLSENSRVWKLIGATLDGVDQKANYPDFTLKFSGT